MNGYRITFYTQTNREHNGMTIANWLMEESRRLGIRGATLASSKEGIGHDGRLHSDNLFDLDDVPQQVIMAVTNDECERLLASIRNEKLRIFYTKIEAEFGYTCDS